MARPCGAPNSANPIWRSSPTAMFPSSLVRAISTTIAKVLHLLAMSTTTTPGPRHRPPEPTALSDSGFRAEHALEIGLHLLQFLPPVAPTVRSAGREVEHRIGTAGGDVRVGESLVAAQSQAFQKPRCRVVRVAAFEVGRGAVAAG